MKEEDATESDIKGLALLLRGLFVYFQIQLHFTEDENHRPLSAAYSLYQGRLCAHYAHNTWESVRSFHISFHQTAINKGVCNPLVWSKIDTTLESTILLKRDRPLDSTNAKRGTSKNSSENEEKPVCFRYNLGHICTKGCTYRHSCQSCGGNHPLKDCNRSSVGNNNGQISAANSVLLGRRS